MDHKIIISLAPTGGWGAGDGNPVTPDAVASDVVLSVNAGAAVVHMHSRDENGNLTADLSFFNRTASLIKESCDVIIEASTGGLSDMSAEERVLPVDNPHAQMGSLNIGSLNFGDKVYRNSVSDVRYWISRMKERNVKPSLEIFDTGHLVTALYLIDEGIVQPPCNFSFIFDVKWGMPWDFKLLDFLVKKIPEGSRWGVIFAGSSGFDSHLAAAGKGASFVRTGFEDSRCLDKGTAGSNAELVSSLRERLEKAGFTAASVKEAGKILLP
ncbi:MAG: 3-keto-5-aminohexanoate cleavage protein [Spirochaetales bacterium]|nr:3-keto-5-aminohexanoate cleavage protein [Spirochaetales bacterium]